MSANRRWASGRCEAAGRLCGLPLVISFPRFLLITILEMYLLYYTDGSDDQAFFFDSRLHVVPVVFLISLGCD